MYVSSAFVKAQTVWTLVEQRPCEHLTTVDTPLEFVHLEDPETARCLLCAFTSPRTCMTCGLDVPDRLDIQWMPYVLPYEGRVHLVLFSGAEHRECTDLPFLTEGATVPEAASKAMDEARLIGIEDEGVVRTMFLNSEQNAAMAATLQDAVLSAHVGATMQPGEATDAGLSRAWASLRLFDPALADHLRGVIAQVGGDK
jgi:hypothetical protein